MRGAVVQTNRVLVPLRCDQRLILPRLRQGYCLWRGASAPSPRVRGEGRGEGASPPTQTRGEAPSPGAQERADLSPHTGRGGGRGPSPIRRLSVLFILGAALT